VQRCRDLAFKGFLRQVDQPAFPSVGLDRHPTLLRQVDDKTIADSSIAAQGRARS
jgi:hypothetical protein